MPNFRPLFRASLPPTRPAPGYVPTTFTRPIKKLVLEYCDTWGSNEGMRRFIKSSDGIVKLAKENPSVEVVVRKRNYKHPIVRGLYLNNRDKVICVRNLEPAAIAQKVRLLLDSSGDKLKLEKGHPVKSTTESVRGIFSPFHTPYKGDNLGRLR